MALQDSFYARFAFYKAHTLVIHGAYTAAQIPQSNPFHTKKCARHLELSHGTFAKHNHQPHPLAKTHAQMVGRWKMWQVPLDLTAQTMLCCVTWNRIQTSSRRKRSDSETNQVTKLT